MLMQAAVELVRRIIEALNRGDVDGMLARMHPDFEWRPLEASPVARVYRGREQVRRYVEDWLTTFDAVRLDLEHPTELADRVVAMVRGRGRGRASGVELDTRFCQVWTVRCGMAVGMEEYATREEALAGLRSGRRSHGPDASGDGHSEDHAPKRNQPPSPSP
jgi:ketosteroid isomerase-like protein